MEKKRTPETSIMIFGNTAIRVDAVKELYPQGGEIIVATETARHVLGVPEGRDAYEEAEILVAMISRSYGTKNEAEEPDTAPRGFPAANPQKESETSFFDIDALEEAASRAETGGNHFYTNPRDTNAWQENELFHRLANPEAVLFLIKHYKSTTAK